MFQSHLSAIENSLSAQSIISANAGHALHKGTAREVFIKEFLSSHLAENVAIGSGELIDSRSKPKEIRNQFEIVLYKKSYPKLTFSEGVCGFLIESVIGTIEVKSKLTKSEFQTAISAAYNAKTLEPSLIESFHTGFIPPKILNYVIAYDGPQKMETVYGWINSIYEELNINQSELPSDKKQRLKIPSSSIDGVFILNKGFLYFDNTPLRLNPIGKIDTVPDGNWLYGNLESGSLLIFFVMLLQAMANIEGKWLNPSPYLSSFRVGPYSVGK